jgi:hypothetical protein
MTLKMFINSDDDELKKLYRKEAARHNGEILVDEHIESGFNLLSPEQVCCVSEKANPLNFKIKCSARMNSSLKEYNSGFFVYATNEISNTPLRPICGVKVIDSGFRDEVTVMLDCKEAHKFKGGNEGWYLIEKGDVLFKVCAPELVPLFVEIVDSVEKLNEAVTINSD